MNKQEIKQWIKDHKKEIATGTVTIIGACIAFKFREQIAAFCGFGTRCATDVTDKAVIADLTVNAAEYGETIKDLLEEPDSKIIEIAMFLRRLPEGWHASAEKVAEAMQMGIELPDGYTIVDSFVKTVEGRSV